MIHCLATNCDQFPEWSGDWADAVAELGICMLPDGHSGPHVWTSEDEIIATCQAADLEAEVELRR